MADGWAQLVKQSFELCGVQLFRWSPKNRVVRKMTHDATKIAFVDQIEAQYEPRPGSQRLPKVRFKGRTFLQRPNGIVDLRAARAGLFIQFERLDVTRIELNRNDVVLFSVAVINFEPECGRLSRHSLRGCQQSKSGDRPASIIWVGTGHVGPLHSVIKRFEAILALQRQSADWRRSNAPALQLRDASSGSIARRNVAAENDMVAHVAGGREGITFVTLMHVPFCLLTTH